MSHPTYKPLFAARKPHDPKRAAKVRELRAGGMALKDIGKKFGISISRVYSILNPEKLRANLVVRDRIADGRMTRPKKCSRCPATGKIYAHHDDYDKPEVVVWLCRPCHADADRQRRKTVPKSKRFSVRK